MIPDLNIPKNPWYKLKYTSVFIFIFATKPINESYMTNEIDWQTADLNEAGEWVEVPAESLLPKWLLRSDEDEEIHFVVPYLEEEFCQWLMKKQGLEE